MDGHKSLWGHYGGGRTHEEDEVQPQGQKEEARRGCEHRQVPRGRNRVARIRSDGQGEIQRKVVRGYDHTERTCGGMVQYADGVGVPRDLHTRGCKIKTLRRRIDLDERYRQNQSMKCPFKQEDDKCVCYRCRTEKWPELYAKWALTESQVELIKSIEPSQRRERAENHIIGEHLFANSGNFENDGRSIERGGGPAAQSIEEAEGQDADQEAARGQATQLELPVSRNRQADGRHNFGVRSGAHLEPSARQQGHDSGDEPLGALEGERDHRARSS